MGGLLRWGADRVRGGSASEAETETSPGVLLSSGYIAGGTVCGLLVAFFTFLPYQFNSLIDAGHHLGVSYVTDEGQKKIETILAKTAINVADAKDERTKVRIAEESISAIDSIRSDAWLESGAAKVLSLIAFGVLCLILFWQGVQKSPKEEMAAPVPSAPPGAFTAEPPGTS